MVPSDVAAKRNQSVQTQSPNPTSQDATEPLDRGTRANNGTGPIVAPQQKASICVLDPFLVKKVSATFSES